ncbi:MAG: ATP-grasp domain-containing protein [Myxococcaceae bacterium]
MNGGKHIGILGGGQLGLMLAESLARLDATVTVLDPAADAPAHGRVDELVVASFTDQAKVDSVFTRCEKVTFDWENIPAAPLEKHAAKLLPSLSVLKTAQDRSKEKGFLSANGFPCVRHQALALGADPREAAKAFGLPCILKSSLGGYDGKGQWSLTSEADLAQLPAKVDAPHVLEERIALSTELSCIVARGGGREVCFPVFENLHHEHVLDLTLVPARVDAKLLTQAQEVAKNIARALDVTGLITVEFFVGKGRDTGGRDALYVNELAPRPHNSGHVTRQACGYSQFDALARVLTGAPLHEVKLHEGAFCMGNLLGEVWLAQGRDGGALDLSAWAQFPEVIDVFLYGKSSARPKRKMGHYVVHAADAATALSKARAFRDALRKR